MTDAQAGKGNVHRELVRYEAILVPFVCVGVPRHRGRAVRMGQLLISYHPQTCHARKVRRSPRDMLL